MQLTFIKWTILLLSLILFGCDQPQLHPIKVGKSDALVEIAANYESRSIGLMHREALLENSGMLFIFPQDQVLKMWMLNVPIPLDVGFFDRQGRLINVHTMAVDGGETIHQSEAPARYALEMHAGWFARNNLASGALLQMPKALREITAE